MPRSARSFEVATEDYALSRRLFMYVPMMEQKPVARSFIDYCMSSTGQNIVERTGFVSQELMTHEVVLDSGYPEEYLKFTEDSQRLSLNFRFKKGSVRLDNKAVRDVDRLVKYMSRDDNKNRQLMLFGFAESFEAIPVLSLDLSVFRADQVSDLLVKNGIDPVRVRGYGSAIPVASNEEPGGRHKNRRVEVWIK
jgi:phosphate transport system substrate-binding protein